MKNLIHERIYDEEVMVLCQHLVSVTFVFDGLPRQHVAKPVTNNLLYGSIGVQSEAQNEVEIGTADGVEDC